MKHRHLSIPAGAEAGDHLGGRGEQKRSRSNPATSGRSLRCDGVIRFIPADSGNYTITAANEAGQSTMNIVIAVEEPLFGLAQVLLGGDRDPVVVHAEDLDDDGAPEILVGREGENDLLHFQNDGVGRFDPSLQVATSLMSPRVIATGDWGRRW